MLKPGTELFSAKLEPPDVVVVLMNVAATIHDFACAACNNCGGTTTAGRLVLSVAALGGAD